MLKMKSDRPRYRGIYAVLWLLFFGAVPGLVGGICRAQTFDVEKAKNPMTRAEQYEKGYRFPNEIQLQPMEKLTLLIHRGLGDQPLLTELRCPSFQYNYRIRYLGDSLVEMSIINCATRGCGDLVAQQQVYLPRDLILRILIGDDTACYRIDASAADRVVTTTIRSSRFIDLATPGQFDVSDVAYVQFRGEQIDLSNLIVDGLREKAEKVLMPQGYYMNYSDKIMTIKQRLAGGKPSRFNKTSVGTVLFLRAKDGHLTDDLQQTVMRILAERGLLNGSDYTFGLVDE